MPLMSPWHLRECWQEFKAFPHNIAGVNLNACKWESSVARRRLRFATVRWTASSSNTERAWRPYARTAHSH